MKLKTAIAASVLALSMSPVTALAVSLGGTENNSEAKSTNTNTNTGTNTSNNANTNVNSNANTNVDTNNINNQANNDASNTNRNVNTLGQGQGQGQKQGQGQLQGQGQKQGQDQGQLQGQGQGQAQRSSTSTSTSTSQNQNASSNQSQTANNAGNNQKTVLDNSNRSRNLAVEVPMATTAPLAPGSAGSAIVGDIVVPLPGFQFGAFYSNDDNAGWGNDTSRNATGVTAGISLPLGASEFRQAAKNEVNRRASAMKIAVLREAIWLQQNGFEITEANFPEHYAVLNSATGKAQAVEVEKPEAKAAK